nr:MAG TPA: hypothetical protein [Caudoviricetes sp.]
MRLFSSDPFSPPYPSGRVLLTRARPEWRFYCHLQHAYKEPT